MTRAPMTERIWPYLRLGAAALVAAAVIAQLERTIGNALVAVPPATGHVPTVIANFLSFFTIQSNIASAVVLVIAPVWGWTKGRMPHRSRTGSRSHSHASRRT